MRKTSGIMILLLLVGMLEITSFATAQFVPDPGVCGIVSANDVPLEGVPIRMDNLNNGEYREQTTAFENPPYSTAGGYAFCMPAEIGDTMQLTVYYNGTEYYGTTIVVYVDFDDPINWFNLSIDANAPSPPPPDDPPDDPPYNPPDLPEDPPDDPPEDPPSEPPLEEPDEQNETEIICHNLTVSVFDNTTNAPINNASVTIYDIETNIIAENDTDESGNVTFQLEEGDYIVEAEKDDYPIKRTRVSVTGAVVCTLSLKESQDQNTNNPYISSDVQEQGFPYLYIGIAGIIITIIIAFLYFWKV